MSTTKTVYELVEWLKDTLRDSGTRGFALGMSGGIDSAVCAALAKRAIDELKVGDDFSRPMDYTLDLIVLPMGNHVSDSDTAHEIAATLKTKIRIVDLSAALTAFKTAVFAIDTDAPTIKAVGNLKARMRMSAIYYAANVSNLMVLGTDNLAETYTGYFTKHGDGAADVFPLSNFNKREVYELGRFLGLPESVLTRKPSAGLWEGQTDEDEMGIPYDFIDNTLEGLHALNYDKYGEVANRDFTQKLNRIHSSTQHKRDAPHVFQREQKKRM